MFQSALLCMALALLSAVECWHHNNHYHYDRCWTDPSSCHYDSFQRIAREYIEADGRALRFCNENSGAAAIKETYGETGYTLTVSLSGFADASVNVWARHRVLFINAQSTQSGARQVYSDVRALPDNVAPQQGSWTLQGGQLVVVFPYRVALGVETSKSCGGFIDETTFTIPREINQ